MLKFSEIFEFSRESSYFERIRMVRSLADRTFQLWVQPVGGRRELPELDGNGLRHADGEPVPFPVPARDNLDLCWLADSTI